MTCDELPRLPPSQRLWRDETAWQGLRARLIVIGYRLFGKNGEPSAQGSGVPGKTEDGDASDV